MVIILSLIQKEGVNTKLPKRILQARAWANGDNFHPDVLAARQAARARSAEDTEPVTADKTLILAVDDRPPDARASLLNMRQALKILAEPRADGEAPILPVDSVRLAPIFYDHNFPDSFKTKISQIMAGELADNQEAWSWSQIRRVILAQDFQLNLEQARDADYKPFTGIDFLENLVPWLIEKGQGLFYFFRSSERTHDVMSQMTEARGSDVAVEDFKKLGQPDSPSLSELLKLEDDDGNPLALLLPKISKNIEYSELAQILEWLNTVTKS